MPAWINHHIPCKVWDKITHPFPSFNGCTFQVSEWISNFIPHHNERNYYHLSVLGLTVILVNKRGPKISWFNGQRFKLTWILLAPCVPHLDHNNFNLTHCNRYIYIYIHIHMPHIYMYIWMKFISKGPINNRAIVFQIMTWHRTGDKALSGPMMSYVTWALFQYAVMCVFISSQQVSKYVFAVF